MNPFPAKIPRGVIYHRPGESLRYLWQALSSPLQEESKVLELEKAFAAYCGRKHGVAFPFARTAVYFALQSLNLPEGSEVILPPITIKGMVDVVLSLGLTPVYADLDPETACFDLKALQGKIGPKVKAALLTPLFGLVPDLEAMAGLLKRHGVFVIEDFSQCLNGRFKGRCVGSFGDLGVYSSSSIKTLDTLGGGLAVTDDDRLREALRKAQGSLDPPDRMSLVKKAWTNLVRNLATRQPFFSVLTFPFLQLLRRLNPRSALKQTGHRNRQRLAELPRLWFCRYSSLQARIGLEHLDQVAADDQARIANAEFVKAQCGSGAFPVPPKDSQNVYWQLLLPVPDALQAQALLAKQGVDSATSSLELVSALEDYPNRADLPEASKIYRDGLFIPCFPHLHASDMRRIASAVKALLEGNTHGPE